MARKVCGQPAAMAQNDSFLLRCSPKLVLDKGLNLIFIFSHMLFRRERRIIRGKKFGEMPRSL